MKVTKHQNTSVLPTKNKLISSPEESEQYRYERAVNNTDSYAQRKPLEEFNNSKLGKILDYVDLGADVISMTGIPVVSQVAAVTGMITGLPQALIGINDYMHSAARGDYKPTLDQIAAVSKLIPTSQIANWAGKLGGRALGKSDKYMRRAHTYFKRNGIPSKIKLALEDLRRLPMLAGAVAPDVVNLATDTYEIVKNKQGGTLPYYLKYFNYVATKEK